MLHMDITLLPKSVRSRIRDVCSRLSPTNAVLLGGGIGHLSSWLFDLWRAEGEEGETEIATRPETFTIIEPGSRFGVIIDRLIRRYQAESWSRVISRKWQEVIAESLPSLASNIALPEAALDSLLPMPVDLIVIDLQEEERVAAAKNRFPVDITRWSNYCVGADSSHGDVGVIGDEGPTPAQSKVRSFNEWIEFVKMVNSSHSIGFAEMQGGTLVGLLKRK